MTQHPLVDKYVLITSHSAWDNGRVLTYDNNPWLRDDLEESNFFIVECHDGAGNVEIKRMAEYELELDPNQEYYFDEEEPIDYNSLVGLELIGLQVQILINEMPGFVSDYSTVLDLYEVDCRDEETRLVKRADFIVTEE